MAWNSPVWLRMLQEAVESLAQAEINNIHALPLSTELAMTSWKTLRLIKHYYPFGNSWQLLTKMFLYFVCLVMFAKIIYSISIPRGKMRVTSFEASWTLFPDGNDISAKLSPSDCPDQARSIPRPGMWPCKSGPSASGEPHRVPWVCACPVAP